MMINSGDIHAQVYTKTEKGVFYVKVSFPDLNMYITSITVRPSTKYPDGELWVQMPAFKVGNRWIKPLEFSNDSQFLSLIKDAALRAVDEYNTSVLVDDDLSLENIEKGISDAFDKLQ